MGKQNIFKCIRNDSKTLPYSVGGSYIAEYVGGAYKIFDGLGGHIIAPREGHYLEFVQIRQK